MMFVCVMAAMLGFAALSMGMSRHQRDVLGKALPAPTTKALKAAGWLLLTASWAAAIASDGAALGSVYWIGALTFGALVVAFSVTRLSR
ncbi:DUF3325 domain-containing protein [Luteibacter aegosomatissinici]|uniref:DUF3325 domain-containing protein n=1 Tax=Luteibacter aegosomatissinici TaxID=2911539 RepID=UPI001FFB9901|nr:DUF3325 domain-containing protein [Luteibacter aegosomatissinici]UPG94624.1 DUF3325 domain-containing protein [Luteibacter aegosomatissinici]